MRLFHKIDSVDGNLIDVSGLMSRDSNTESNSLLREIRGFMVILRSQRRLGWVDQCLMGLLSKPPDWLSDISAAVLAPHRPPGGNHRGVGVTRNQPNSASYLGGKASFLFWAKHSILAILLIPQADDGFLSPADGKRVLRPLESSRYRQ